MRMLMRDQHARPALTFYYTIVLRKADRSFQRSSQTFRPTNRDGYPIDLIKSLRSPPWKAEPEMIGLLAMLILAADPAHSVIFTKPS